MNLLNIKVIKAMLQLRAWLFKMYQINGGGVPNKGVYVPNKGLLYQIKKSVPKVINIKSCNNSICSLFTLNFWYFIQQIKIWATYYM